MIPAKFPYVIKYHCCSAESPCLKILTGMVREAASRDWELADLFSVSRDKLKGSSGHGMKEKAKLLFKKERRISELSEAQRLGYQIQ
ncbi:hypothetical protein DPMN_164200 [Dreissena polymorpha]|uniref:Uncharacterized protein n=1 Tax=Dreissena polymorpha TaxID=45954 RepID=A0A9D4ESH3_DREPO|nr:hypothetical protein DPMN_164200 [Dreissena polymorpha]